MLCTPLRIDHDWNNNVCLYRLAGIFSNSFGDWTRRVKANTDIVQT